MNIFFPFQFVFILAQKLICFFFLFWFSDQSIQLWRYYISERSQIFHCLIKMLSLINNKNELSVIRNITTEMTNMTSVKQEFSRVIAKHFDDWFQNNWLQNLENSFKKLCNVKDYCPKYLQHNILDNNGNMLLNETNVHERYNIENIVLNEQLLLVKVLVLLYYDSKIVQIEDFDLFFRVFESFLKKLKLVSNNNNNRNSNFNGPQNLFLLNLVSSRGGSDDDTNSARLLQQFGGLDTKYHTIVSQASYPPNIVESKICHSLINEILLLEFLLYVELFPWDMVGGNIEFFEKFSELTMEYENNQDRAAGGDMSDDSSSNANVISRSNSSNYEFEMERILDHIGKEINVRTGNLKLIEAPNLTKIFKCLINIQKEIFKNSNLNQSGNQNSNSMQTQLQMQMSNTINRIGMSQDIFILPESSIIYNMYNCMKYIWNVYFCVANKLDAQINYIKRYQAYAKNNGNMDDISEYEEPSCKPQMVSPQRQMDNNLGLTGKNEESMMDAIEGRYRNEQFYTKINVEMSRLIELCSMCLNRFNTDLSHCQYKVNIYHCCQNLFKSLLDIVMETDETTEVYDRGLHFLYHQIFRGNRALSLKVCSFCLAFCFVLFCFVINYPCTKKKMQTHTTMATPYTVL